MQRVSAALIAKFSKAYANFELTEYKFKGIYSVGGLQCMVKVELGLGKIKGQLSCCSSNKQF
jgi:hypothetical protein